MADSRMWKEKPPAEASAEDWARVWVRLIDLIPTDQKGERFERDDLLVFVLDDAARRCAEEAERRKPGVLREQVGDKLQALVAELEEYSD